MNSGYKKTVRACFVGYIVQAIVNNFAPLLFLTFQKSYNIPLSQITLLVTVNFGLQLVIDLASVSFIEKIGYRASLVIAHIVSAVGLVSLTFLPELFSNAFLGLLLSVVIYAVGGGLLEVLISPVVEACPTDNKETAMSLLHSFYCWGHVGVVLVSTAFFYIFGISNWKILAVIWAIIPLVNSFIFLKVPINQLNDEKSGGASVKKLCKTKLFWVFMLIMLCAGASEQAVSQWASTFAEQGLGVNKTIGDLAGPMSFAVLMGISRVFYGKFGEKIDLNKFMIGSSLLCVLSYICIGLVNNPVISLVACAVCGLSVGIMWPGAYSKASASINGGSTALFALLALAGDLGCTTGPTLAGEAANIAGGNLKTGILCAVIFPVLLIVGMIIYLNDKSVKAVKK